MKIACPYCFNTENHSALYSREEEGIAAITKFNLKL